MSNRFLSATSCPAPKHLGPSPSRLVVVVPATTQGPEEWNSFLAQLKQDARSSEIAWLVYDHHIGYATIGHARDVATSIAACIDEKVRANGYSRVTLIGHSLGGMLVRNAYLVGAGAMPEQEASPSKWTDRVDKILLFASVNKGVPAERMTWWFQLLAWLGRTFPHPHLVVEDSLLGSDFIADTRIAWIRHFGHLQDSQVINPDREIPQVVQFWGTRDSVVNERDNADLTAFSGPVLVRIPGATHRDMQRLETAFSADPQSRWAAYHEQLFNEVSSPHKMFPPRRVLIIARGIRDSTNSDWVKSLRTRAEASNVYGKGNVFSIEYGYFSAAHFALRPLRRKPIPTFRDLYAQLLATNPNTRFDFIGHSNGTYILGQSLLSTPSMRFRNVVLAAPVLPVDFDWNTVFRRGQVDALRYETASGDWPVGILCPALRALGFSDVGPGGVLLFGTSSSLIAGSHIVQVGWYPGGHGAALRVDTRVDNLEHLLNFAEDASDISPGETTDSSLGGMRLLANLTPFLVWAALIGFLALVAVGVTRDRTAWTYWGIWSAVALTVTYVLLDVT